MPSGWLTERGLGTSVQAKGRGGGSKDGEEGKGGDLHDDKGVVEYTTDAPESVTMSGCQRDSINYIIIFSQF